MDYQQIIDGIEGYGVKRGEICLQALGLAPDLVKENVILAPWWEPGVFEDFGSVEVIGTANSIKKWLVSKDYKELTYIQCGIGAPVTIDTVLALGLTRAKKILFVGSVGALDPTIGIGDIVIPEYSVCGDGASRYIAGQQLTGGDVFGERAYPDAELNEVLKSAAGRICAEHHVRLHAGRNFSIDTIFAQFAHLDEIMAMGCNVIEMETAAAFRAARLVNIRMAALFSVSDNTVQKKSLIGGRTREEIEYRRQVRRAIFPKIIWDFFGQGTPGGG